MARVQNFIADKMRGIHDQQQTNYGQLRSARMFDYNNYEYLLNSVSGRLTSDKSQRIAVAQSFGGQTEGLIVGGRRDSRTRDVASRPTGSGSNAIAPKTPSGRSGLPTSATYAKIEKAARERLETRGMTPEERRLYKKGLDY